MSDSDMFYCSFVSIHYIICECGETFPSEEDLKLHLDREHAQKKERKEYRCGICDAPFDSEDDCIKHYENSHIGIQDEHDYVEVYTQEEDDKDEKDVKDLELENVITIPENVMGMPDNIISIPYDDFDEEVVLEETVNEPPAPIISKRAKTRGIKKPKSYYAMKNVICEVCGKKYASNAALRYHQRVHTGERPYKCTECTKSFTMPLFLQIHVRTHTGERPYACPHCPKAFSNKAALLRHDRVHTGIKPYECPKCGKSFTQSNSMKLHVNTVHLKMPAPYKSKSRRTKQREKEMQRQAMLREIDNEDMNAVESISQTDNSDETEVYIKPEVVYKQEVGEDLMLEDVGQEMITYEVIYEGQ